MTSTLVKYISGTGVLGISVWEFADFALARMRLLPLRAVSELGLLSFA